MMRKVVNIDADKCTGCGKCADACVEGAIKMIDGKAVLVSEAYCDGLGACLPHCPADAISIEQRETVPFSEPPKNDNSPKQEGAPLNIPAGGIPMTMCAGSGPRRIVHKQETGPSGEVPSRLCQWPIQLRLIPTAAPYLNDCDLLLASDCSAFAYGNFHERFIKDRIVIIGCPKLDPPESWKKLADIVSLHNIRGITVTRMDVPCCSALVNAAISAIEASGKEIPLRIFTVFADGTVKE